MDSHNSGQLFLPVLVSVLLCFQLLAGTLVQVYRRYGQFTSGALWVYWLIASVTSIAKAYLYYKRVYWVSQIFFWLRPRT